MMLTITLILSGLVALNFLLLIFSCNKTTKKVVNEVSQEIRTEKSPALIEKSPNLIPNQLPTHQLAPTGS